MVQNIQGGSSDSPAKKKGKADEAGAAEAEDTFAAEAAAEDSAAKGKKGIGKRGKGAKGAAEVPTLSNKELSKAVMDLSRLALVHDDAITSMEGWQLRTFLLPKEATAMVAGREEGARYFKKASGMDPAQAKELGAPHVYIALASLKNLNDQVDAKKTPEGEGHLKNLEDLVRQITEATMEEALQVVSYWRINQTHEGGWRLRFRCRMELHEGSVSWYTQQQGGKEKVGKAPKGKLARQVQQLVEKSR